MQPTRLSIKGTATEKGIVLLNIKYVYQHCSIRPYSSFSACEQEVVKNSSP